MLIVCLAEVVTYDTLRREQFSDLYLAGPTKCFSCERQFGSEYAWKGKATKCFSCEQQFASVDPDQANYSHGTKCFSCEK